MSEIVNDWGGGKDRWHIDEEGDLVVETSAINSRESVVAALPASDVAALLRSAGYLIYAPGAEADRARSDAEIAGLSLEAARLEDISDDEDAGSRDWRNWINKARERDDAIANRRAADDAAKEGA